MIEIGPGRFLIALTSQPERSLHCSRAQKEKLTFGGKLYNHSRLSFKSPGSQQNDGMQKWWNWNWLLLRVFLRRFQRQSWSHRLHQPLEVSDFFENMKWNGSPWNPWVILSRIRVHWSVKTGKDNRSLFYSYFAHIQNHFAWIISWDATKIVEKLHLP